MEADIRVIQLRDKEFQRLQGVAEAETGMEKIVPLGL